MTETPTRSSKAEVFKFFQTLSGLVKKMENQYSTIDLKNEVCVTGKITKVDGYMNVEMQDVMFYDMRGKEIHLNNFFISARSIRYVHIPKRQNAIDLLDAQYNSMTRKKPDKKRTFKVSRAEKKNLDTVREAYSK